MIEPKAYIFLLYLLYYSVLKATTGSFLAANLAGTKPAINVSNILMIINIIAPETGSFATFAILVRFKIIALAGILLQSKLYHSVEVEPFSHLIQNLQLEFQH